MDIRFFEEFNIVAGLSQAPDFSDLRRADMVKEAKEKGEFVIRPCLVHGTDVMAITPESLQGKTPYIIIDDMDGLVTDVPGVTLTSTHGDCIPLYAYDPVKRVIGLAHAGWKGTVNGIASELAKAMIDNYSCNPADIKAVVGPGIGRCHFEVSEDVAQEFMQKLPWHAPFIDKGARPGKYMIDLKGINAEFLKLHGITDIQISPVCTYEDENCYSYRRTGTMQRMLAYIKL